MSNTSPYIYGHINNEYQSNPSMSTRVRSLPNSMRSQYNSFRSLPNQKRSLNNYYQHSNTTDYNPNERIMYTYSPIIYPPETPETPVVYVSPHNYNSIDPPLGPRGVFGNYNLGNNIVAANVPRGPSGNSPLNFSGGPSGNSPLNFIGGTSLYKKVGKKEVLGKDRVIYKMKGSNKEYLKTKGMYIPVSEYKKLKK